jgi:hypothetical protein
MSLDLHLQALEHTPLTGLVRRVLGDDSMDVAAWDATQIHGGGGAASSGVYRVAGTGHAAAGTRPWSLVLKVLRAPAAGTTFASIPVEGWDREVSTYRSGLLDDLPTGLAAPRCFAIGEQPGFVWLWLEDVTDEVGPRWPIARFAQAARHLGRLNGAYLGARPLPAYPWLQRNMLRWRAEGNVAFWAGFDGVRDTPEMRQSWPDPLGDRALRLWHERHGLLDRLDRLPQTLVHGDADRRNLFARRGAEGDETVAIDWAFTGVAALGEELVNLVTASALWFQVEVTDLADLADQCLEGYVSGLTDVGWRGDPRLARVGFVVAAALRYGPFAQLMGHPAEDVLACWAAVRRFAFDRLDAARGLIEAL